VDALPPAVAAALADTLLGLHALIVLLNVAMPPLVIAGAWRRWRWVRHAGLRVLHLAAIGAVAAQALAGELCVLTVWESALRQHAGDVGYATSFIATWLDTLLYVDIPLAALTAAYLAWAALSLGLWWAVPPEKTAKHR
jgi:hypothetical protein